MHADEGPKASKHARAHPRCRVLVIPLALAVACTSACARKAAHDALPAPPANAAAVVADSRSSPSATGTPPPPPAPNGANVPSSDPMATLFGTMASELRSRPGVHPSVDDGFAALAKAGVPIPQPKQSLGSTYKAAYCAHGVTAEKDISVLLCEYADAEHAALGAVESRRLFPGAAKRVTTAHKALLLVTTVQNDEHPDATAAAQKKVVAALSAL